MPRIARVAPGDVVYHVLNRGNGRQMIFHKDGDAQALLTRISIRVHPRFKLEGVVRRRGPPPREVFDSPPSRCAATFDVPRRRLLPLVVDRAAGAGNNLRGPLRALRDFVVNPRIPGRPAPFFVRADSCTFVSIRGPIRLALRPRNPRSSAFIRGFFPPCVVASSLS